MRKKTIRTLSLTVALILAASMIAAGALAADPSPQSPVPIREKPDVNALTNFGQEPPELTVQAEGEYISKPWYEYISYSRYPVASYRIDEDTRLLFYDPTDYASAMLMDIQDESLRMEPMNSISFTHEIGSTISLDKSESTSTESGVEHADGPDKSYTTSASASQSSTSTVYDTFSHSKGESQTNDFGITAGLSRELSVEVKAEAGLADLLGASGSVSDTLGFSVGASANVSSNVSNTYTEEHGYEYGENAEYGISSTTGWSEVADRIITSTGSSSSISNGWSATESDSVTRTYEAAYFHPTTGAPLPWTLVEYTAKMPMRVLFQMQIGGKWVTVKTDHVLLTTISGTCRAFMKDGIPYFEHWATGEPVTNTEFWDGFFTEEQLIEAYQTNLYPHD